MCLPATAVATPLNGAISGTVTDAGSSAHPGIEGAQICAAPTGDRSKEKCANAGAGGKYTIPELESGEYTVEFTGNVCGNGCELEYVKQVYSPSVNVKPGETVERIDAGLLEIAGKIAGRVTSDGSPVEDVDVCAYGFGSGECGETNVDGEYTIEHILPGSYKILFRPHVTCEIICQPATDYVFQYWNDQSTLEAAGAVVVKESQATTGVNAELQLGGRISGRVTTAAIAPQPIANLMVCASSTATNKKGERVSTELGQQEPTCALTNSAGEYTISALASGGYEVELKGEVCVKEPLGVTCTHPYIAQFYQSIVTVTAPGTTSGIDASLLEVSPTKPALIAAPTLTGTPAVGKTLSCSQGGWANNPTNLAYRWLRDGVAIAGHTSGTYTLQHADAGNGIACEVTASNAAGASAATSNTVQIPNQTQGLAVLEGVSVRGATVSVTLRCTGANPCAGALKIRARVSTGRGRHRRTRTVTIGLASFSIGVGKRATFRVYLTGQGRKLLRRAGRRGLSVQIAGVGVKASTVVLRQPPPRLT